MSENEKKNEVRGQCWKTIFIAIALLAIGAVFGHLATVRCCQMMGRCGGGYGMKACWDKGRMGSKYKFGDKFGGEKKFRDKRGSWCSKKAAYLSEPNKAGCPMMGKKADEPKKD